MDLVTITSIIGAVSGLLSILGVIYVLGYRLGRIETKLELFDPLRFASVELQTKTLWEFYGERGKAHLLEEMERLIKEIMSQHSNPHDKGAMISPNEFMDLSNAVFRAMDANVKLIELNIWHLHRLLVVEEKGPGEEFRGITTLSELTPGSPMVMGFTIEVEGRKVEAFAYFHVDQDRSISLDRAVGNMVELEEGKGSKRTIEEASKYASVMASVVTTILGAFLKNVEPS